MAAEFTRQEIPLAYSMIDAASRIKPRRDGRHPVDKFFLLWTAFSSIYTLIADRQGHRTRLVLDDEEKVLTYSNGSVNIPRVEPVSESEQLSLALDAFDDDLKDRLIQHGSTQFFASRIPFWGGKKVERDAFGQRLNGVIDVDYTTSAAYPVWSPIDLPIYASYLENPGNPEERDFLSRQILDLLYTIRKNLVQLDKTFDDAQDIAVYEHGLPLLEMIVAFFTR